MSGNLLSWREYRKSSPKQSEFLDYLTLQGDYARGGAKYRNTTTPTCLIGGAGEGGKSYNLRTAAFEILFRFRELGFPNRIVGLMCDTKPNLQRIHIKKLREELRGGVEIAHSQEFGLNARLVGGAFRDLGRVCLLHAPQIHKVSAQKGNELDGLLVDELTSFTREQIGEMRYQLRTSAGLPFVPFGASSNPDGIGHDHVSQLFVPEEYVHADGRVQILDGKQDIAAYYELDPEKDAEELERLVRSVYYIPMVRQENPAYEANKESMDRAIREIPNPAIRHARDTGYWGLYISGRFGYVKKKDHGFVWKDFLKAQGEDYREDSAVANRDEAYRLLANADIMGWDLWASFDYGTDEDGASCLLFHVLDNMHRIWTFGEWYKGGLLLPDQAKIMKPLLARFPVRIIYADPSLRAKTVESQTGLTRLQQFASKGIVMYPAENARVAGWAAIDWVFERRDDDTPVNHVTARINWEECPQTWKQLGAAPRKPADPEDVDDLRFKKDHGIDCYRYGIFSRFATRPVIKPQAEYGSITWMKQQAEERKLESENPWK